jgi:RHS repeat-associated protein
VEQKSYTYQSPTGTQTAPTEGYGYDGNDQNRNPITPAPAYPNTRLTRSINELDTVASDYSYDQMGRVTLKSECLPGDCTSGFSDLQVAATYTPAGDISTLTNETIYQPHTIGLTYGYDRAERLSSLTSNWTPDNNHPGTLFSAATTSPAAYNAAGQLLFATLGTVSDNSPDLTETRTYDIRDRATGDSYAAASILTSSATHSTGTIVITPATTPDSSTAQPGSGSATVAGDEQSTQINPCEPHSSCPQTLYDSGTVTVTINGTQYIAGYGQTSSSTTIAEALATAISNGTLVNASVTGTSTVTLVAKTNGASTDYSLSVSSATSESQYFSSPSFTIGDSGSALTGGSNGDSGTITATIDGCNGTYNYGSTDTAATVASALSSSISTNCGSIVTGVAHDNAVSLTSAGSGSTTNWPVSVNVTNTNNNYTSPFFSAVAYGMSNGFNSGGGAGTAYSWAMPPTGGGYDAASNILLVDDSINGAWNYTYDTLNRLVTGSAASGPFGGNYGCWIYDGFGDRTSEAMPTSTSCSNSPVATVLSNYNTENQITSSNNSGNMLSYSYDKAGNVAYDGSNYYIYDGAGRQCAAYNLLLGTMTQYIYDAEGNRAAKGTLNWTTSQFETAATTPGATCPTPTSPTFTLTTQWVTGFGGEQLSELQQGTNNTWAHSNFFFGSGLHVTYLASDTQFDLTDWLGTKRVVSGASGCLTGWVNYPYGNGLTPAATGTTECSDGTEHHFTSKERDSETNFEDGNDYFLARYYGSETGRFLSPDYDASSHDPEPEEYANTADPQTLNLYHYVHNNPISATDSDGHTPDGPGPGLGCHTVHNTEHGTLQVIVTCVDLGAEIIRWIQNKAANYAAYRAKPRPTLVYDQVFPIGPLFEGAVALDWGSLNPPEFANTPGGFVNWLKNLQESGTKLNSTEADTLIKRANELGVDVRLDPPHPGTNWNVPHLNIGNEGQVHLEVPEGYSNPRVATGSVHRP